MDASNRLTGLQRDFLDVWFAQSKDFFLTGGGALIGFYGLPRTTQDIDLFTTSAAAFSRVPAGVHDCCATLAAQGTAMVTSPHFRRFRVERGDETTLVDFVEDLAPQVFPEKTLRDGFILDPAQEIAVNKVCAIVSRSEPRDFYDLQFLAQQGFDPEEALRLANQKDGGVNEETLAMVLQSLPWDQFRIPNLETSETSRFFVAWLERLILKLHPHQPGA